MKQNIFQRAWGWLTKQRSWRTRAFNVLRAQLGGALPGMWASKHLEESLRLTGWQFVAIRALSIQASQATVSAHYTRLPADVRKDKTLLARYRKRRERWRQKVLLQGGRDQFDHGTKYPLPSHHPLLRLLRRPNPYQSQAIFWFAAVQQIATTGTAMVWIVRNALGVPVQLYILPTALLNAQPPNAEFPSGSYRVTPLSTFGIVPDGTWSPEGALGSLLTAGGVIDARAIKPIRWPHTIYLGDGLSPMAAGALTIDVAEQIDRSRWSNLRNTSNPGMVFGVQENANPHPADVDAFLEDLRARNAGTANTGKDLFVPKGIEAQKTERTAVEADFTGAYPQLRDAVLALFGVPPVAAGVTEAGAYAAYYASLKQFTDLAVQPVLSLIASELAEELTRAWPGIIEIVAQARAINDPALRQQEMQTHLQAKAISINEYRAAAGYPPVSWGDIQVGTQLPPPQSPGGAPPSEPGIPDAPSSAPSPAGSGPADTTPLANSTATGIGKPPVPVAFPDKRHRAGRIKAGFTGTDRLGRRWENGKLVPREKDSPQEEEHGGEEDEEAEPHRSFQSVKEADQWGSQQFAAWKQSLSSTEKFAVEAYSGGGYEEINAHLREKTPLDQTPGKTRQVVEGLDAALAKGSAPENLTTFRGVRGDFADKLVAMAQDGQAFTDAAFLSSSLSRKVAQDFASKKGVTNAILEISVPKGSSGAYIDVLDITGEAEWLSPRDSVVQLTSAEQGPDRVWVIKGVLSTPDQTTRDTTGQRLQAPRKGPSSPVLIPVPPPPTVDPKFLKNSIPDSVRNRPPIKPPINPGGNITDRLQEYQSQYNVAQEIVDAHEQAQQSFGAQAQQWQDTYNKKLDRLADIQDNPKFAEEQKQLIDQLRTMQGNYDQVVQARQQLSSLAHQWIFAHVGNKPAKISLDLHEALAGDEGFQRSHKVIKEFMGKAVGRGGRGSSNVPVAMVAATDDGREFYNDGFLALRSQTTPQVAIHEFGHHLEETMPGVKEAVQEFLAYRVGEEEPQSLRSLFPRNGYEEHEVGRKDHFDRVFGNTAFAYYAGKHYDSGSTEVLSMGLEKLYHDPVGFARADPEYFNFVVGILDGSLRKGK